MRVLDLLLPPACAGCRRSGELLCSRCLAAFRPPFREDDRFVAPDAETVVGSDLLLARAAFAYEGPMRTALAALKYGGVARVARPLARAALPTLRRLTAVTGPAVLVPVPVHPARRRERGYDQADLLALELGRAAHVPMARCLVRVRHTTKQHRLDRAARLRNLRDAFAVRGPPTPPHRVILVDDIVTTTATLEACASVLRAAGCEEVYGVAIAREV
jgi:ComF family protein